MLDLVDESIYENDELKHYGIIGMHWGIRRYQNPDGSLTPEGRIRYGVGTAEEALRLSYSQDYMVLKQKKNRNEKEEEKLKRLERGKKHFEGWVEDPDYFERLRDELDPDEYEQVLHDEREYFDSTNYGKGQNAAALMMSIPTTAIGAAVDVGAVFVEQKLGLPLVTGLGAGLGVVIGANLGNELHSKNLDKLKEEINEKDKTKKVNIDDFDDETMDLLKNYNLDRHNEKVFMDLSKDADGNIVRKDGKMFEYYLDGRKQYAATLDEVKNVYMNNKNFEFNKGENSQLEAYKNFGKNFKGSWEEEWWNGDQDNLSNHLKSFDRAVPAKNEDLDVNVRRVMELYGLNKEDLVVDKSSPYDIRIYRKDGQAFEYMDNIGEGKKKYKQMDLQYLAEEGNWVHNNNFIPLNKGGSSFKDTKVKGNLDLGKLSSSRVAPSSSKSKSEQRDEYFSKNYRKLFFEVVNKLERQGYDVFVDGVDGYAWINDSDEGRKDFTYQGRKYDEVDSLVTDILATEFEKKYG